MQMYRMICRCNLAALSHLVIGSVVNKISLPTKKVNTGKNESKKIIEWCRSLEIPIEGGFVKKSIIIFKILMKL